jgi:hypothetical protein
MNNMVTKSKPIIKKVYIHKCSKEELLDRMNKILVGNGAPEEGLAFRFGVFMEDHKKVVEDISEIKGKVTEAIESSGKAIRAIEIYKAETEAFDEGQKEKENRDRIAADLAEKKKQDNWQRVFWIVTALLGLTGIFLSNLHTIKNSRKIDNLGTPVITNSRGMPTVLPNGDQLRMYPKDFTGDTTKTKKTSGTKK